MSNVSESELNIKIEKATSESIPNGELDLSAALEVSDIIRSRRILPREGMRCLKKRIMATESNPYTTLAAWKLTDMCIKNGGIPFIQEVCSKEFMDSMERCIIESDDDDELHDLVTRMFYELYLAFNNDPKLGYLTKVYSKLKSKRIQFPNDLNESNVTPAMFEAKIPAAWMESDACMICSKKFNLLNRKHHCRSCGGIFCQEHSSKEIPLPELGIHTPVRVCDDCYYDEEYKKSSGGSKKKKSHKHKHSKRKATYDNNEDQDLKRAIELSLKESKSSSQEVSESVPLSREDQEDLDLKAAIAASLQDAEVVRQQRNVVSPVQNTVYQQQPYVQNSSMISPEEEDDIYLFASLVERMKSRPATDILEDTQLQTLYRKVMGSRPRLNAALNDTIVKHNTLLDMNGKISNITNTYDTLLEKQLSDINLSQQQYKVQQHPTYRQEMMPQQYYSPPQQSPVPQQQYPIQQQIPVQSIPQQQIPQQVVTQQEIPVQAIPYQQIPTEPISQQPIPNEPVLIVPPTTEPQPINNNFNDIRDLKLEESEPPEMLEPSEPIYPENNNVIANGQNEPQGMETNRQGITSFNFPTVPVNKVNTVAATEPEVVKETPPVEEELLLEL